MHEHITVSTGVVFRIKDVPLMVFMAINKELKKSRPKVPIVYIKDKGRDEPNPNDPEYIQSLDDWEVDLNERMIDASIMLGLEPETVPDGIPEHTEESWSNKFTALGINIPDNSDERFLQWVRLIAAPTLEDILKISLACSRNAGVTEEDVAEMAQLFRNIEERRADRVTFG